MEEQTVLSEKRDNVGIITFNRPHRLNAINGALLRDLLRQLQVFREEMDVRSVILTGTGKAFCAGEDLKETSTGKSIEQWALEIEAFQNVQRMILGMGKPLIGAINGYALGGGLEFALSCDIRIASEDAIFGFPETGVGMTVTTAGSKLITQIVGLGKAKELVLTGRFVDAREALAIGLVNSVVARKSLMEAAMAMCRMINRRSPLALKLSRIAIDQGMHSSFEQILELESSHLSACINAGEQKAFVEKKLEEMKR